MSRNISLVLVPSLFLILFLAFVPVRLEWGYALAANEVDVWWPENGAHIQGTQPFKAHISNLSPDQYEMFWQVDGGEWVWMDTNNTDAPHKEASVDVSGWSWRGEGPYKVNFIARKDGQVISQQAVEIYVGSQQVQPVQQVQESKKSEAQPIQKVIEVSKPAVQISNDLYVNPNNPAVAQAAQWRVSRPQDAQAMDVLAAQPSAVWLGGWSGDVEAAVRNVANSAREEGGTPVFIAYNVPGRDCGGYSAGGVGTRDAYMNWISGIAKGLGGTQAIVVLEPDALANITCLNQAAQEERVALLASAVKALKSAGAKVYLDAGHSKWNSADTMAARLQQAGIQSADGFSLNVSNFNYTSEEVAYGTHISQKLGGTHFVVDTSRNGNGSNGEWCNPSGRAIGEKPTLSTGNSLVDAYLWLKTPGESDGSCNGAPAAGVWWPEYALSLVKNSQ